MFVDIAKIFVKAGNGGNGCVSFHREKYVASGGPDGGDGGRGGDVIFVANQNMTTLADFKYKRKYLAESGKDGSGSNSTGRSGEDIIIEVPVGTIIKNAETERVIADLTEHGEKVAVAKGGKGGAGNKNFATPTRQIPSFSKPGDLGEELTISLELKLLADVSLIGFPNVGKSTILSIATSAKPKIGNYHFTTIHPNLGVANLENGIKFIIADVPGLIEGAHEGIGLGHEFLKHIERTKVFIHVVDISGIEGRDPIEDFETINQELHKYNSILSERTQIVAANKIDILQSNDQLEAFTKKIEEKGFKVFPISAATKQGITELMNYVGELIQKLPNIVLIDKKEVNTVYEVKEKVPYTIKREDDIYVIEGEWARKIVASTNFENYESLQYFQRAIKSKGILEELESMGIQEGDTVRVHDFEFEYVK